MNRRAKCDVASFILVGEIYIRTKTNKQTESDISTPCLSAYVDNNCSISGLLDWFPCYGTTQS